MATFVLVPGACLGAWAWEDTVRALEEQGHTALPLTLTGVAERADQGKPDTNLDTHISDITGFVENEDLRDVTLVAHSYAAAPVTAAAARLGDRLERVVYVDSAPFFTGMRMLDLMPPEAADELQQQVAASGEGWKLPVETMLSRSNSLTEDERDVLRTRGTPHPFGTYTQPVPDPVEPAEGVDRVLIACREFTALLDAGIPMLAHLSQPPWRRYDLPTGHWPMLSAPKDLATTLHAAVS
ncbi:alpha/beta fold hydrolase [Spirillospora sp. NPDC049652]